MEHATQFCVGLENRTGVLAKLCQTLSRAEVNIEALFVSEDEDCCWVNMIAVPTGVAENVLSQNGYPFVKEQVLRLPVPNQPGELERVVTRLADAGVNIDYVYGSGTAGADSILILSTDDVDAAIQALHN